MPRYWLSFDLGLRGNYDELYAWLDSHKAKECGDGVATFVYEKTRDQVARELKRIVGAKARVYLISKKEGGQGLIGKFVIGKRRAAPWSGYAVTELDSEEIEQ